MSKIVYKDQLHIESRATIEIKKPSFAFTPLLCMMVDCPQTLPVEVGKNVKRLQKSHLRS